MFHFQSIAVSTVTIVWTFSSLANSLLLTYIKNSVDYVWLIYLTELIQALVNLNILQNVTLVNLVSPSRLVYMQHVSKRNTKKMKQQDSNISTTYFIS